MKAAPVVPPKPAGRLRLFLRSQAGVVTQIALVAACVLVTRSIWLPVLMAAVALGLIWLSGEAWADLGFGRPPARVLRWITEGLVTGLLWGLIVIGILLPALNSLFDISPSPSAHEGDLAYYLLSFFPGWIINALCKGVAYRAFLLHRLEMLFGRTTAGVGWAVLAASVLFGLGNWQQGLIGIVVTSTAGAVFNMLFYWSRRNLWPTVLAHGAYNTVFFSLIFLGRL